MQHPNREHASRYLHVHIKAIWWGTTQCVWRSKLCYLKISFYLLFNRKWMDKPFKQLKQKELFKNSMNKCVCSIPVELKDQVMFRLKLFEALMDISRFLLAWKKKKKQGCVTELKNEIKAWGQTDWRWRTLETDLRMNQQETEANFLFLSHLFLVYVQVLQFTLLLDTFPRLFTLLQLAFLQSTEELFGKTLLTWADSSWPQLMSPRANLNLLASFCIVTLILSPVLPLWVVFQHSFRHREGKTGQIKVKSLDRFLSLTTDLYIWRIYVFIDPKQYAATTCHPLSLFNFFFFFLPFKSIVTMSDADMEHGQSSWGQGIYK